MSQISRIVFCLSAIWAVVPCYAEMALTPVPHQGITVGGWIGQQMREDAEHGWASTCDRMARQGWLGWDANTQQPYPYYQTWSKGFGEAPAKWNRSVPYYQPIVEPLGSYGEGEFEGHWLDAVIRFGWIAGDKRFRDMADKAINDILASRDSTGYIGVDMPEIRFTGNYMTPFGLKNGRFELSGMLAVIKSLMTYHQFTGDERVLKACVAATDLMLEKTKGRELQNTAGGLTPLGLLAMYRATRNEAYRQRAALIINTEFEDGFGKVQLTPQNIDKLVTGHTASTGILLLEMLNLYELNGDQAVLDNAIRLNNCILRDSQQPQGVPTGHAENLVPSGPGMNTEGCDIAWFGWAWMEMLRATRDARYADLAEKALLNALPGQRSKDGAVSPYFARPNQLFAVRSSGMGTVYGARVTVECCHGNLGRILPVMAEYLVLKTRDGGLAVPFYADSTFRVELPKAGTVELTQKTEYPFSETIRIQVKPQHDAEFPIRLRAPAWCKSPSVTVNGNASNVAAEKGWIELRRTWKAGDVVELALPMEVTLDARKDNLFTVNRGPLVYALAVQGQHRSVDQWGSFEELITPESKWNYALLVDKDNPNRSFMFKKLDVPAGACLWEKPRVALEVDAVRLTNWRLAKSIEESVPGLSTEVPEPLPPATPQRGDRERIQLVPYGCTILRMTELPILAP